jgi:hypothetical protein
MLTTLNPPKKSHSHILEGCLCVVLGHLGLSPSLAVFIGPRPPQEQETFVRLEAPYRVHILNNAMAFHQTLISFRFALILSSSSRDGSSNALAKQVKGKL